MGSGKMRTFLVLIIACWGCVAAGTLWAEGRNTSYEQPLSGKKEQGSQGVGYTPSGLKRTLARSTRAYDRSSVERDSLSVEERALRSREWRRVLEDAYSAEVMR